MTDLAALLVSLTLRIAPLQPPRISETVTVTGVGPSIAAPAAVTTLGQESLASTPSVTLDDALRSVPGFSLFRRSSSRVANPTTQGVTLRGLAASGSSRALVLADDVPLNDPVGGWVYWNRVPSMAIQEVSVARGASGDLHGADAMGGVVTLRTLQTARLRLLADGGDDRTARVSAFGGRNRGSTGLFGAAEGFTTDGFVTVAPESRGPVDTAAASRYAAVNGTMSVPALTGRATIRGSHFGEARRNGTPLQDNSTRVTQGSARISGRGGWSAGAYALAQRYRQTFSAVNDDRTSERQTSEQNVEAIAGGAAIEQAWSGSARAASVSASTKLTDADLEDASFTVSGVRLPPRLIDTRQLTVAAAAQGAAYVDRVSTGAGVRLEVWRSSFEQTNQHVFVSPRLWTAFALNQQISVRVAYQSAHRGPTINELYRPFRVGNVITDANPSLTPESARDVEAGFSWHTRQMTVRVAGFGTHVDDAIVNVTLSSTGPTILRQRQNAAAIRAAGMEIETELRPAPWLSFTGSTSYTNSVFVEGPLEDLRVPQVPRWHHAIGTRAVMASLRFSGEWRYIGRQFDDDRNLFPLDRSSMFDARVGWRITPRLELFGAVENLLDEEQDVGRTPLRTIGLPRTSRIGIRVGL